MNELRESVAQYAHDTWTAINASVLRRCTVNEDGSRTLPAAEVERRQGLMATDYADLSKEEQDKDRAEADKVLALVCPELPDEGALVEFLADAEHASWARWMAYLFSKCEPAPDGGMTIPPDLVARWQRQVVTSYAYLSEREKQSDRDEVAHILPAIRVYVAEREAA